MRSFVATSVIHLIGVILLLGSPSTEAFTPSSKILAANSKHAAKSANVVNTPVVALKAYKKREPAKTPEEKEKTPPLKLFITYMTPWLNPNSIFVYMFAVVIALGKYSEAHPHGM
ncbi:MAG: hypothetical protein SGBAC_004461 [Bacillariaceae sp.]